VFGLFHMTCYIHMVPSKAGRCHFQYGNPWRVQIGTGILFAYPVRSRIAGTARHPESFRVPMVIEGSSTGRRVTPFTARVVPIVVFHVSCRKSKKSPMAPCHSASFILLLTLSCLFSGPIFDELVQLFQLLFDAFLPVLTFLGCFLDGFKTFLGLLQTGLQLFRFFF